MNIAFDVRVTGFFCVVVHVGVQPKMMGVNIAGVNAVADDDLAIRFCNATQ